MRSLVDLEKHPKNCNCLASTRRNISLVTTSMRSEPCKIRRPTDAFSQFVHFFFSQIKIPYAWPLILPFLMVTQKRCLSLKFAWFIHSRLLCFLVFFCLKIKSSTWYKIFFLKINKTRCERKNNREELSSIRILGWKGGGWGGGSRGRGSWGEEGKRGNGMMVKIEKAAQEFPWFFHIT